MFLFSIAYIIVPIAIVKPIKKMIAAIIGDITDP
jgi:hypothetical protein